MHLLLKLQIMIGRFLSTYTAPSVSEPINPLFVYLFYLILFPNKCLLYLCMAIGIWPFVLIFFCLQKQLASQWPASAMCHRGQLFLLHWLTISLEYGNFYLSPRNRKLYILTYSLEIGIWFLHTSPFFPIPESNIQCNKITGLPPSPG